MFRSNLEAMWLQFSKDGVWTSYKDIICKPVANTKYQSKGGIGKMTSLLYI